MQHRRSRREVRDRLLFFGFLYLVSKGIQINLNAAFRKLADGSFVQGGICGHSCVEKTPDGLVTGGHYLCKDSAVLNKGVTKSSMAPANKIFEWIGHSAEGLELLMRDFLKDGFEQYCDEFQIPISMREVYYDLLLSGLMEYNLFGADPEIRDDIYQIIAWAKNRGGRVNLTCTGRRFISDAAHLPEISKPEHTPHVFAFSLDDVSSVNELKRLLGLSLTELKAEWKLFMVAEPHHGQLLKVYECLYATRLIINAKLDCQIVFNMVVHKGNLYHIKRMLRLLAETFPSVILNPYPGSSSFDFLPGSFEVEDLPEFGRFVDFMIYQHVIGNPHLSKRLHYWLMLRSALDAWKNDPVQAVRVISGYDLWTCYAGGIGAIYNQIGISENVRLVQLNAPWKPAGSEIPVYPGGEQGCFWFPGIGDPLGQVKSAEQVRTFAGHRIKQVAYSKGEKRCPGCLMGRLIFHEGSMLCGLCERTRKVIRPRYLHLRRHHVDVFRLY